MSKNSILNTLVSEAKITPEQAKKALEVVTNMAKEQMPILQTLIDNFLKEELRKANMEEK